ncbi:MAG: HD domain-containing protein, partial [Phycisphaerae bacterium]|nr:HD domain-containing protein [Phycisphaerae bacterium]
SSIHDASAAAWSSLQEQAQSLETALASAGGPLTASDPHSLARLAGVRKTLGAACGDILVVDGVWHIQACHTSDAALRTSCSMGAEVAWTPAADSAGFSTGLSRGWVDLSDGRHAAVIRPIGRGDGYVVLHQPVALAAVSPADLSRSLALVSGVTLLWICMLSGIGLYMVFTRFQEREEKARQKAAQAAREQAQTLIRTRDAVIFGLAKLADSRDPETGDHLERIAGYSTALAAALREHPKFHDQISPTFVRLIGLSAALHDIGKVGIEDRILRKPGPLTADERRAMQEHAVLGGTCLQQLERRLGSTNFLQMAREIAFGHHEWWDGTGYPLKLAGEQIPLAARIVAIADVYDAIRTKRVYKEAIPHEKCVEVVREHAGTQFDPVIVEVWLGMEHKFRAIADQYTVACSIGLSRPYQGTETVTMDRDAERFPVRCTTAAQT